MLNRYKEFKHDWEKPYLEGTRDLIFRNTFKDIEFVLKTCQDNGTRFEFECYDIGHLYNLRHFLERGLVKPPLFVQSVFGILGGIGTHPEDVMHMRRTADRLFGRENYRWSVLGAGRTQMPIAAMAAAMGGNVRVGLEDSLWIGPGKLAQSNAEQVTNGAPDHRRPRPRDRDAGRRARDPGPQGPRQGEFLVALSVIARSAPISGLPEIGRSYFAQVARARLACATKQSLPQAAVVGIASRGPSSGLAEGKTRGSQ